MIDPPALMTDGVLIDLDHVEVLEDLHRCVIDISQVVGHDERRGKHGPDRHLNPSLLPTQGKVPDDQLRIAR